MVSADQSMQEGMASKGCVLRMKQVTVRVGLKRSTIYAQMKAGRFPRSMKLSTRASGWFESDIDQWLNDRQNDSQVH